MLSSPPPRRRCRRRSSTTVLLLLLLLCRICRRRTAPHTSAMAIAEVHLRLCCLNEILQQQPWPDLAYAAHQLRSAIIDALSPDGRSFRHIARAELAALSR